MDDGLVTTRSSFSVADTAARLEKAAQAAGLLVFDDIDHAGNATAVGQSLRPTRLLLIGHPRGGTPLMAERQTAGIDLPLKVLVWQDETKAVWLTYDDAHWIARRHGLGRASAASVVAIAAGMATLASIATGTTSDPVT